MPFLTNTSITYITQAYYHLSPIDENFEQLKKAFNPLVLLPLPSVNTLDYTRMMKVSKISELDDLLDQSSDRRSKKKVKFLSKENKILSTMFYV